MEWIYLASAIFGGSFVIPMILGGLGSDLDADFDTGADFDVDTDFDVDADFDVDTDFDVDVDADVPGDGHHLPDGIGHGMTAAEAIVGSLLSFRSVVFFATFFGVAGLILEFLNYNFLLTLVTAVLLGGVAAVANSALFGLLKASESSSQVSERSFAGRQGTVTVPITEGKRGRIRIDMGGQPQYLVAAGYSDDDHFDAGHPVAVLEVANGIALVTSLKKEMEDLDLDLATGSSGQLPQAEPRPTFESDDTVSDAIVSEPIVSEEPREQRPSEGT